MVGTWTSDGGNEEIEASFVCFRGRKGSMLVSWGCHNKLQKLGGLKQEQLFLSKFWRLEERTQGVSMLILPPKVLGKDAPSS